MKAKNTPVGTVECNHKGCTEQCNVFKFRPRPGAEGRRTVFTGKHYFECSKHGRVGADGNVAVNEYILSNAKWKSPASAADSPKNPAPATTPARGSSAGSSEASPPVQSPSSGDASHALSPWRTLLG